MAARTPFLRVGGSLGTEDGATVVWNVAEGARGRRWRWIRTERDGTSVTALLETAPDGRPTRLEVASAAGLLVLHPELDGSEAHGNVVGPDGVRPLAFGWGPAHVFDVAGLPWVAAACHVATPAGSGTVDALAIDRSLSVSRGQAVRDGATAALPTAGGRWPLE